MVGIMIFRRIHTLAEGIVTGLEVLCGAQAHRVPDSWTHITKIDPEVERQLPLLYPRYLKYTSAVAVGGSSKVTPENSEEKFYLLSRVSPPVLHEPSDPSHVTDTTREFADFLAIPEVLNGSSEAFVGTLGAGIDALRTSVAPKLLNRNLPTWLRTRLDPQLSTLLTSFLLNKALFEAYIIQNPDSAAARKAEVTDADVLSPEAARRHAISADSHLQSEIVYVEYSGAYGGTEAIEVISAISDELMWSKLWYGGGLESREQVRKLTEAGVDAVVVGNIFHKIASEEIDLYQRSRSERLSKKSWGVDDFETWIMEAVDVASTAAARYLSTTAVDAVQQTATRLLAETLATYDSIEKILSEYTDRPPQAQRKNFLREYPQYGHFLQPDPEEYLDDVFSHLHDPAAPGKETPMWHTPVTQL
jgi:phosphoglycerol geranylgeranyltransferase